MFSVLHLNYFAAAYTWIVGLLNKTAEFTARRSLSVINDGLSVQSFWGRGRRPCLSEEPLKASH